jgi:carbon monoxide dehydrogenase subunit G
MTRIEQSIEIEAPVEKVWAFVIDIENFAKTNPPEVEMEVLSKDEGPQRIGFTAKIRAKIGGNVFEVEDEITEMVANKRYSGRQKGGSLKRLEHTDLLEPTERGTKLTTIIDYELPYSLLGKIIDKLKVHKEMEKSGDYSLKKTKELLEKK